MSSTQVRAAMPGDPPPRPRGWTVAAGGLLLIMAYVAWWSVERSSVPNGYLARRGWDVAVDGPWRVPYDQLRTWLSAMGVEGALAIWVLSARWEVSLAWRCGWLAASALLVFLCMSPLLMHASAPFPQHLSWLGLAMLWMMAVAIIAAVATRVARARPRRRAGEGRYATS